MNVRVYAPVEYWKLTQEEKDKICNGCGGRGGKFNFLIPQKYFKECCNIHDYLYNKGQNENDKRIADRLLAYNMNLVCDQLKGFKRFYYKQLAKVFHKAVVNFGDYYFWKNKAISGTIPKSIKV